MSEPTPLGLVHLATSHWKSTKPASQHFYNHSYTTPTTKEYTQQQLGLAISDAIAIHLRDAKKGNLRPATPKNNLKTTMTPMPPIFHPRHPMPISLTYTPLPSNLSTPAMILLR